MGIEYNLVKLKNGHAYELGKTGAREPEIGWMKKLTAMNLTTPYYDRMQVTDPSSAAMWHIGSDTSDCQVSRFSERWNLDSLTEVVDIALNTISDKANAQIIAQDMLNWAGSDEVILIPDALEFSEIMERHGSSAKRLKVVRSIYDLGLHIKHL